MMKKLLIALPFLLLSSFLFAQTEQTIDEFWPQFQTDVQSNGNSAIAAVLHNGNELDDLDAALKAKVVNSILTTHYADLTCMDVDAEPFKYLDEIEIVFHSVTNNITLDDGRVDENSVLLLFGRVNGKYKLFNVQLVG